MMGMRFVGEEFENINNRFQTQKETKKKKKRENLAYLFYMDYFKDFNYHNLNSDDNKEIAKQKANYILQYKISNNPMDFGNTQFKLKVAGMGLLTGIGYPHNINDINGGLSLGFSLDYTKGVPYIPASSIKGVVIHILEDSNKNNYYEKELKTTLKKEDFANDIFFNAEIIANDETIFDDDFVTPHRDITENPIPIRFLKIKEGVMVKFCFDFKTNKDEKERVVKKIILDVGLGAKTNLGYGKFIEGGNDGI